MFSFRNIDNFLPSRFERMGLLKGKRWYINREESSNVLFKPRRQEFGDKKVFCGNHYGEFIGYLLTLGTEIPACKCELAHLSRYYENIHKERNHGTAQEKDGCITYSELKPGEELEHGKTIVEYFSTKCTELYEKLTKDDAPKNAVDNLEVILASIEDRTRDFYKCKQGSFSIRVEEQVKRNRKSAIQMMVYDCLYGNNDRHDENWAMRRTESDIELYPMYDNERVLGLYENQTLVENAVNAGKVEEISEDVLFSRMRVPGEAKKYSSYKDVLNYLMDNYKNETASAIKMFLTHNSPSIVNKYLVECEGLPDCYKEFGAQMYKSRYEFVKELYRRKLEKPFDIRTNGKISRQFYNKKIDETVGAGEGR